MVNSCREGQLPRVPLSRLRQASNSPSGLQGEPAETPAGESAGLPARGSGPERIDNLPTWCEEHHAASRRPVAAMMPVSPSLVWFRQDLRLADHAALDAALQRGGAVIPVYIHAPEEEAPWPPGAASRWWLHQSLTALAADLRGAGAQLVLQTGPTLVALRRLATETGAGAVFWNRRYEPAFRQRDGRLQAALQADGLQTESFAGGLLNEPEAVRNRSGRPFQVFTPFWRACLARPDPEEPLAPPAAIPAPRAWPKSVPLAALELEPKPDWTGGLRAAWRPGSAGAERHLARFLEQALPDYEQGRNHPGQPGTSRLSPHLHFGEITPRQVWHAVRRLARRQGLLPAAWRGSQFLAELGWREFAGHLLYHFPNTPTEPLRAEFKHFPWRRNTAFRSAWQRGQTGFPIVDAGLRELWMTGWMHNRVRMIAASFLVKDLLLAWQEGAAWFWDTLVDADLAANTLGWQWTAGCGADAAPYFRVFNPVTQGEKFDPEGEYVRRWCPELAALPNAWVHQPWQAPEPVLARAGLKLGRQYPAPIVNHAIAREVALEAFAKLRQHKPE